MSDPIATERYRLALIAHHAYKLAELLCDGKDYEASVVCVANIFGVSARQLETLACYINEQLNKEETK